MKLSALSTKATTLFGLLIATSTFQTAAQDVQYQFEAVENSINTRLCIASASNNVSALKMLSKRDVYGMRGIAEALTCNEKDITSFAVQYGAYDTAKYLSLHAPNKYKINTEDVQIQDLASNQEQQVQVIYVASN